MSSRYAVGTSSFNLDNLVLQGPIPSDGVKLKVGNQVKRGQLVVMDVGLIIPDPGTDPTKVYGIASEDVDATAKEEMTVVYVGGVFALSEITFPAGKDYSHYKEALRNKGIILR